jgi:hypothetical protein
MNCWITTIYMRFSISRYELRMLIIEDHQFHDRDNTLQYSWKQSCDIIKRYVSKLEYMIYTNKCYIWLELTCFLIQKWIIITIFLIYIVNVQLCHHNIQHFLTAVQQTYLYLCLICCILVRHTINLQNYLFYSRVWHILSTTSPLNRLTCFNFTESSSAAQHTHSPHN